jgi:Holliday junction resolvasome RuvABC DNA-binding subunit
MPKTHRKPVEVVAEWFERVKDTEDSVVETLLTVSGISKKIAHWIVLQIHRITEAFATSIDVATEVIEFMIEGDSKSRQGLLAAAQL